MPKGPNGTKYEKRKVWFASEAVTLAVVLGGVDNPSCGPVRPHVPPYDQINVVGSFPIFSD